MLTFYLDHSGTPTYLQIAEQVRQALRLGTLRVSDQLPRVKDVVGQLTVNPNTVLKAYRELEHEGLISSRPGVGTFIAKTLDTSATADREALIASLREWIKQAQAAGLDEASIRAVFVMAVRESQAEVVT